MTTVQFVCTCIVALPIVCAPQHAVARQKPDLSGVWIPAEPTSPADAPQAASPGGPAAPPRTLSLTIVQTPSHMRVERRVTLEGRELTFDLTYKLDGTESVNQQGPLVFATTAGWDDAALVLSSTVTADTRPIGTVRERYQMQGDELIVETTRHTPAGEFVNRHVHRRQGTPLPPPG